jgi:quercetin dioxygenase-like cupin family protein
VNTGIFNLYYIDPKNADKHNVQLITGDIVEVTKGTPHQLEAITDGEIFEVSTIHFDYDSYRIEKGDSQNVNG